MKHIFAAARFAFRMVAGSRMARRDRRQGLQQAAHPEDGVRALFAGADPTDAAGDPAEAPIFILSAGWRSGSTLLQRLVCSGDKVLIWGEPYDRATLIQSLARTAAPFSKDWPPEGYMKPTGDLDLLASSWTANLYPPEAALRAAYRGFFLDLFARPARELGADRWGLKEVRLGHAEAVFLQALFPAARFLFIRRRLRDAYLSYRGFSGGMGWYAAWPKAGVFTPFAFARNWAFMALEVERAAAATGGILIEYEDLVAGRVDLARLAAYCGSTIDPATLDRRVGSGIRGAEAKTLSPVERGLLQLGLLAARWDRQRGRP